MAIDRELKSRIVMELLARDTHSISRPMLQKRMWAHYSNADELDAVMEVFREACIINTVKVGNVTIYVMPQSQVDEFKQLFTKKAQ